MIEIEIDDKVTESIRDIFIPAVGDAISLHDKVVRVKGRHWVIDKKQQRVRELRCILICEKTKG